MEVMEFYHKHYIKIDDKNRIVQGFSDAFSQPQEGDICIWEKGGRQFRLFEYGEENPALKTIEGIPLYQWDGQAVQKRTQAEIQKDRKNLPETKTTPTTEDRLSAMEWAILGLLETRE